MNSLCDRQILRPEFSLLHDMYFHIETPFVLRLLSRAKQMQNKFRSEMKRDTVLENYVY